MKKITGIEAYCLLVKDVLYKEKDECKKENRWICHCFYVGMASRRIAKKLNLDKDYAMALGFIHDIGRKISHPNHPIEGYKYMIKNGYEKEARICLTHSFIDNDIKLVAGGFPSDAKDYEFVLEYLNNHPYDIYDNIVQLSDLICTEKGITTLENRMLDITLRKGVYDNSYTHFKKAIELKQRIEEMLGCSLYELFPEINQETIKNCNNDYEQLENMLNIKRKSK